MAIYNKEVERSIFTSIGEEVKNAAINKSLKRRKNLVRAGLVFFIIGIIFLIIVIAVNNAPVWLYVVAGLITLLGLFFLILGPSLHASVKKKYSFDSYVYGQEHYSEVLKKVTSGSAANLSKVERIIVYVDELKQAEIVFTETKGVGRGQETYITYRLTYADHRAQNITIVSKDTYTMNMLNSYLTSKTYAS